MRGASTCKVQPAHLWMSKSASPHGCAPRLHRAGLTRLEVVLLLAMFLVSGGLLLGYVANQRENANQQHCANNLRRIGQAILGFHEVKKFLPAARIAPDYATWAVQIAPYLQTDSGLDNWDLAKRFSAQTAASREAALTAYFCPARSRSQWLSTAADEPEADRVTGALGDYACASGDGAPHNLWTGIEANGAIILGEVLDERDGLILRWQGRTTLASLVRGQNYTLLVGEKHVPLNQLGQAKAGDTSVYNGALPAASARVGGPGFEMAASPTAPGHTNFGSAHHGISYFVSAGGSVQAYANTMSGDLLGKLIRRQ